MFIWGGNPLNGPIAAPGTYRVRISANGISQTKSFTIRRDPRIVGVTDTDLREQFALASRINERTDAANRAVIRLRSVRDQVQARAARNPAARTDADRITRELTRIEEELYQTRNRSGQDPLNFPIKLNNRLAALQRSVETGDAKPTAASYVVFRELSAELDKHLAALNRVVDVDVARFNSTFR